MQATELLNNTDYLSPQSALLFADVKNGKGDIVIMGENDIIPKVICSFIERFSDTAGVDFKDTAQCIADIHSARIEKKKILH